MPRDSRQSDSNSALAALLSAVVPGLGQVLRGRPRQALTILLTLVLLVACGSILGRVQDRAAEIFFFILVALPWWAIQSYDAFLPATSEKGSLWRTLCVVWSRGHDIRYLGALFLLSALMDVYIIVANPNYALPFFCTKPTGTFGILAKAQSPTLHVLIGLGFLGQRRWSLFLYVVYAGFGLLNAVVNSACFGFGRIRTVLMVSLVIFTAYVLWRRRVFVDLKMTSQQTDRAL